MALTKVSRGLLSTGIVDNSNATAITIASSEEVTFAAKIISDAGIDIDNINIDGTTIALSSGNLTLDVAGSIIFDADGADYFFKNGGTEVLRISGDATPANVTMRVMPSDGDFIIKGNDGGSAITALTLDMSAAGAATLNNGLTLTDGNLVVANGHGIDFSATGDPSGKTSELFDDYEEGTWTPALNSGSLGVVTALYRKIGNQVTVQFYVNNIAPNSNTLTLKIDGLPYTAQNVSNYYASGSISYSGNAVTGGHGILVPYNAAYIYFHLKSGSGAPAVTNNNWIATVSSGQPLIASITYFTA